MPSCRPATQVKTIGDAVMLAIADTAEAILLGCGSRTS
jgi:hypothetical protein